MRLKELLESRFALPLSEERAGLILALPELHFAAHPGLQELRRFTPVHPGKPYRERVPTRSLVTFDPSAPIVDPCAAALFPTRYMLQLNPEVTEPVSMRFSSAKRWKGMPPSQRRRSRSWRFASDAEKLSYAPMLRRGRYPYGTNPARWPWWAQHPDRGRRRFLGTVIVRQPITVYALQGADVSPLLRQLSDSWCAEVTDAFAGGSHARPSLLPASLVQP